MSRPPRRIRPDHEKTGSRVPQINASRLDLPEPLGPISVAMVPGRTERDSGPRSTSPSSDEGDALQIQTVSGAAQGHDLGGGGHTCNPLRWRNRIAGTVTATAKPSSGRAIWAKA